MTDQPGVPPRKATLAPFGAAVAVIVVIVASIVLWPRTHSHADATSCPKSYPTGNDAWVPKKPATSNPGKALVPSGLPNKAVICGYEHAEPLQATVTSDPLTASKQLHGDPRAVVTALRSNPSAAVSCTYDARSTDRDNYLLALSYDGKVVWVSIPGDHCAGTSNGVFKNPVNLRADAVQALMHGVWPTDPSLTGMCDDKPSSGGAAQLSRATSVALCLTQPDRLQHVYRFTSLPATVVARYDSAATGTACDPGAGAYVARIGQAGGGSAVLVGSDRCVAGPGHRYLSGAAAADLDDAFTRTLLAVRSS